MVALHAERIVSLNIRIACELGLSEFFGQFQSMPYLRSLTVYYTGFPGEEYRQSEVVPLVRPIRMPSLTYLELDDEVYFPDPMFVQLPRLSYLRVSFTATEELGSILSACPGLRTLDVFPFYPQEMFLISQNDARELRDLTQRVPVIRLLDVKGGVLESALDTFSIRDRSVFELDCADLRPFQDPRALEILSHVAHPLRLAV
ncbi:hypothetical protein AURDEDRAFT_175932 [Auricularia subglabra TFB-10046 SS5]|uniref:F-box domain-containing protein n=1 Tax=Auricularia subglabra (strain TFB-10046 / SS5) TaxID=717982 RepID=J0D7F0_AURST|nr:hypothetical protein AURDEDRAFT_175932 [Auricularia subglabra TFB-10046 SS5]